MPANETMVMHDMRNLLSVIYLQVSQLERFQDDRSEPIFRKLAKSLDRATSFASSKVVYEMREDQEIVIPTKLKEILDELKFSIPDLHNGTLQFENSISKDILVKGKATHVYRILFNIIYNAVCAIRDQKGAAIKVEARVVGREVTIAIMDNGPGIPAEVVQLLKPNLDVNYEPNRRVGLGISIATSLSKKLGGYLELSKTDNFGTTFLITLPCNSIPKCKVESRPEEILLNNATECATNCATILTSA
jgi:C4-dicarboxylate-specific signal transduction histidine kinase